MPPTQPTPNQFQGMPGGDLSSPQQSHKNKLVVIVIAIVVLLLIGAAMTFGFGKYEKTTDENGTNSAENTQKASLKNDQKFKTHVIATIPSNLVILGSVWGPSPIGFSDNGSQTLYSAVDKTTKNLVTMRNSESLGELSVGKMSSSRDGARVNYVGTKKVNGAQVAVINDIVQHWDPKTAIRNSNVVFSANGKNYGYTLNPGDRSLQFVYNNEVLYTGKPPQPVVDGKIQANAGVSIETSISPDDSKIAFIVQDGLKKKAVFFNTVSRSFVEDKSQDGILSHVVFTADSKHYAYRARNNSVEFIVIDGVPQKSFAYSGVAWPPTFSYDGKKIMYAAGRAVGSRKDTLQVLDVTTGTEVAYVENDFPSSIESRNANASLDSLDFSSGTLFDAGKKNKVTISLDQSGLNESDPQLMAKYEAAQTDPIAMSELLEGQTLFVVSVNDLKINLPFAYVSTPQFSQDSKYVFFGARQNKDIKWIVYDVASARLAE